MTVHEIDWIDPVKSEKGFTGRIETVRSEKGFTG
jgi:hypothetical protein